MNEQSGATAVRVWDLPTRVFHWVLAACVIASIVSARIGGNAMVWHMRLGYAALALLAFRLLWGLLGGHWSRFRSFVYTPAATVRYLRGTSLPHEHHDVGHSPLAAFSVFGLLGILVVQVATGLFADDEIANTGPLVRYVASATSLLLTKWHKGYGQWLMVTLLVLHVGAVAWYLVLRKRNLVRAMLTGDKLLVAPVAQAVDNTRSRLLALVLLAICSGLAVWVASLAE